MTTHLMRPDRSGTIFCKRRNRGIVWVAAAEHCRGCKCYTSLFAVWGEDEVLKSFLAMKDVVAACKYEGALTLDMAVIHGTKLAWLLEASFLVHIHRGRKCYTRVPAYE